MDRRGVGIGRVTPRFYVTSFQVSGITDPRHATGFLPEENLRPEHSLAPSCPPVGDHSARRRCLGPSLLTRGVLWPVVLTFISSGVLPMTTTYSNQNPLGDYPAGYSILLPALVVGRANGRAASD